MKIESVDAYQIFDSRGTPTVEAIVRLENQVVGCGVAPVGKSTGQFESVSLTDTDHRSFGGRSVFRAIANVRDVIAPELKGHDVLDQVGIDNRLVELDGTPDKSHLGSNAVLSVSMAVSRAAANALGIPLFRRLGDGNLIPLPQIQIFGGGAHANWQIDIQDFQVTAVGAKSYDECLEMYHNVYRAAEALMTEEGKLQGLADEGGFWPVFESNQEALETVLRAIETAGYEPGRDVALSLDVAADDLFDGRDYHFRAENRKFTREAWVELLVQWCETYPIVSIEDPLAGADFESWRTLSEILGRRVQLIGDDLFCTSVERIEQGIQLGLANSVLIKPNQVGTITETLAAIRTTQEAGWLPVISARSGETEDAYISHLAVATNAGQLKVGSFARGERTAKWNELVRINRQLGADAAFLGGEIYKRIVD